MNKKMSIKTKHHSFWWLIIKWAGDFNKLIPKKVKQHLQNTLVNNLDSLKTITVINTLLIKLRENEVENLQGIVFLFFYLTTFSNLTRMDISHLVNSECCHWFSWPWKHINYALTTQHHKRLLYYHKCKMKT